MFFGLAVNIGLLLIFGVISIVEANTIDRSEIIDKSSDESNELQIIDSIESLENDTIGKKVHLYKYKIIDSLFRLSHNL